MRKVSFLSYNMTQADGANQDGLIPIGRQFDFINAKTLGVIFNCTSEHGGKYGKGYYKSYYRGYRSDGYARAAKNAVTEEQEQA